jgi:hypothetical protein
VLLQLWSPSGNGKGTKSHSAGRAG